MARQQCIINMKSALFSNFNSNVGNAFIRYVNDQEFDVDGIEDDVMDSQDCIIADYLSQRFPSLFEEQNAKLPKGQSAKRETML